MEVVKVHAWQIDLEVESDERCFPKVCTPSPRCATVRMVYRPSDLHAEAMRGVAI